MTDSTVRKVLKWGILGTARINRALIPPLRASQRNDLYAIASRKRETAEAYAREWDIPQAFGSYESLLADPEVDVIYNPLPNSLHAEWTIKAARAGKHVLCEKPLALSVEDVDAIEEAAQAAGVFVAEAFMYRHHVQTLKVKEMVENGDLGDIISLHGSFTFNLQREGDVRLNPALGGGSIWDVGCYPINYMRYIVGNEPQEVAGSAVFSENGVDVVFAGQLHFPGDIIGQFDSGFRSVTRMDMEIVGRQAAIRVPNPFKPRLQDTFLLVRDDRAEEIKVSSTELYLGEVEDMADAILTGKRPRVTLEDSRGNIAAILACLEAAREHRLVQL